MKHFIENIIHKLGKKDYKLDKNLTSKGLIIEVLSKIPCIIRGSIKKIGLKKSSGILFAGRHCKLRHKYLITILLFAAIIGFLDENSAIRRLGYAREISRLQSEIEKYRAEYEENTKKLNELSTNPDAIEQIAREKYLMKKPNEDIYVFKDK